MELVDQVRKESYKIQKDGDQVQKESDQVQDEGDQGQKESDQVQDEGDQGQKESDQVQKESDQVQDEGGLESLNAFDYDFDQMDFDKDFPADNRTQKNESEDEHEVSKDGEGSRDGDDSEYLVDKDNEVEDVGVATHEGIP
ncbi:hypothetical protein L1987_59421 [Smallanthus sonchifolius]|uniref:Uncharacterized protein n=1 Tax=Smallanthus sonchifolius TaxID=185202 RepID=A0ACB9D622_9ASTR|nr:hypothetical protein L1987_59421 [Smallanthus sonchifolius]